MADSLDDSGNSISTRGIYSDSGGESGEQALPVKEPRGYIPYSEWIKTHPENKNATHVWHKKKQMRKK